jgi:methylated-DNA-protein-cysteine methyltransferase related protein
MAVAKTTTDPVKAKLLDCLARVPAGRVVCHRLLSHTLGIDRRHVVELLRSLDDAERARVPWHRAVADGGAIGRHPRREEQMRLLRAEGIPVAPVGIVHELAERRLASLSEPASSRSPPVAASSSRARGLKDRPRSSLG